MRRLGIVVIFFLLGCAAGSSAIQEATIERGADLLKHGAYKDAIAVFAAILDKKPSDAEAAAGLGRALIETGDYQGAEARLKAYLASSPESVAARIEYAQVFFETGRYPSTGASRTFRDRATPRE